MRLVTKAIDCTIGCPYRHFITGEDDFLPRTGDVKLKLHDAIVINRYAATITHHRISSSNEWTEFTDSNNNFEQFKCTLQSYYEYDGNHRKLTTIEAGQLCGVLMQGEIFRGRVISRNRDDTRFRVLFIDTGKLHALDANTLLLMPDQFHMYPAQTVDVVLMGIEPNDEHRSNAMRKIKKWLKLTNSNGNNFCSGHLVGAFERTLLVRGMKCHIAEQAKTIQIEKNLVGYGFAEHVPIQPNKLLNVGGEQRENGMKLLMPHHSTPIMKNTAVEEETVWSESIDSLIIEHMRSVTISSYRSHGPQLVEPLNDRLIDDEQLVDVAAYCPPYLPPQKHIDLDDIFNLSPSAKIGSMPLTPIRLNGGNCFDLMDFDEFFQ